MSMLGQTPATEIEAPISTFEGAATRPAQSYWNESWERLRANRIGMAAGILILILAAIAAAAPLFSQFLTHYEPYRLDLLSTFQPPGRPHLLGTDELGRDTLTRLIYGGLMRIVDMVLSIPAIFLFILMSILFRPNPITLAMIIASVGWGGVARLVRGEVLSVKQRDFIMATRSIGARDLRLIVRHLLPNVLPVLIVAASLGVGQIILIEAALDFLGLGIQPPTASWGNMLTNSESYFFHSVWLVIFPGVTIFIMVLASNIFGNAVRDAFDPRLK